MQDHTQACKDGRAYDEYEAGQTNIQCHVDVGGILQGVTLLHTRNKDQI